MKSKNPHNRVSEVLKKLGVQTSLSTEGIWAAGRAVMALTTIVGAIFYLRNTTAYIPVLGLAAFALVYDVAFVIALTQKRVLGTFLVGFALDNLVILGGWWLVASAEAGALQTNDLYLILFPVLVIGAVRLGWVLGIFYTALWLGWMVWTFITYFPPEGYNVQQIPLRLLFIGATVGIVLRLISRLASEQKRVESLLSEVEKQARELKEKNLQLEETDRLRQTLLLAVAHELKTPITVIKANAEMLQSQSPNHVDNIRDRLFHGLNNGVERLESLIGDALDYIAIQGGNLNLELQNVDIVEIYRGVLIKVRPLLSAKGQKLEVDFPKSAPLVLVEPRCCEQVLRNLISYASACSDHGATIAVKVTVAATSVQTCVADKGPRICDGDREKVFLPFYGGGEPDGRGSGKGGLGLALAKQLAEIQRGKLWVESNSGHGNIFRFVLPRIDRGAIPGRTEAE